MRGEHRGRFFRLAIAAGLAVSVLGVAGTAMAQVPALPDPPPQVISAINTVEGAVYPPLDQLALQGSAGATAIGFALRPECSELGYVAFLGAVAGPSLPVGVIGLASPLFVICGGAFADGPADPYLHKADVAAGPDIAKEWRSVVVQAHSLRTTTPQAGTYFQEGCSVIGFAPPSSEFPPPSERFQYEQLFC